jgi:exonuclease III
MTAVSLDYLAGFDPATIKLPSHATAQYYDIPYALYQGRVAGQRFLVGGDWNISPELWDAHHHRSHQREFFDRAQADGWIDCYRLFHGSEGRTWFRGNDRPYQMDHLFADIDTSAHIRSCDIDTYPAASLAVSDHAAMILVLELSR